MEIKEDYKKYVLKKCKKNSESDRGEFTRLANYIGVNSSFISQVLKGDKHFSLEQILKCSQYFTLTEMEEEYLIHLHQYDRAGSDDLKKFFHKKLLKIIKKKNKVSEVLKTHKSLSFEEQSIFYSNWYYSAIRLSTEIEGMDNLNAISEYFNLNKKTVSDVINFLLENNLIEKKNNRLSILNNMTHLKNDSPFINNHHKNWRIKSLENYSHFDQNIDLAFTSPLTISEKDFLEVRAEILDFIKKLSSKVSASKSEKLACLNIDFFSIK